LSYKREALKARLRVEEGEVLHAYQDSLGLWTIGVGHLIDANRGGGFPPEIAAAHPIPVPVSKDFRIPQEVSDALLDHDIAKAEQMLDTHAAWWRGLDEVRQQVMVDLVFNMGWGNGTSGLSGFHNTLAALESANYAAAGAGLRASRWYGQVGPGRAEPICKAIETGLLPA
jgi:lysozyme